MKLKFNDKEQNTQHKFYLWGGNMNMPLYSPVAMFGATRKWYAAAPVIAFPYFWENPRVMWAPQGTPSNLSAQKD